MNSNEEIDEEQMNNNEKRALNIINQFELVPSLSNINKIIKLLEQEIDNYQEGSSEYIRVLCEMLFCIGNTEDNPLIEKAKYSINMDVGCMVDSDWLDCFKEDISIRNTNLKSIFILIEIDHCRN